MTSIPLRAPRDLFALVCSWAASLFRDGLDPLHHHRVQLLHCLATAMAVARIIVSSLFNIIPPSLLSIYLYNQKQTRLFTLINA